MSFGTILYTILISPLQMFFEFIFSVAQRFTNNQGLSIIVLSLVMKPENQSKDEHSSRTQKEYSTQTREGNSIASGIDANFMNAYNVLANLSDITETDNSSTGAFVMEASTTLCGTKAGAEIHHGGSYPDDELIYNTVEHNQLMEKTISSAGVVDFFEGGAAAEAVREQEQWLDAIINDKEPLVKPEQAFVVTQILEGIYKSAETGKEVFF